MAEFAHIISAPWGTEKGETLTHWGLLAASLARGPECSRARHPHPPLAPVYLCSGLCTRRHMHIHHRQTDRQTDIRERFKNQKWLQKVLMKVRCHTDILNMAELSKVNREKCPGCGDKSRVMRGGLWKADLAGKRAGSCSWDSGRQETRCAQWFRPGWGNGWERYEACKCFCIHDDVGLSKFQTLYGHLGKLKKKWAGATAQ